MLRQGVCKTCGKHISNKLELINNEYIKKINDSMSDEDKLKIFISLRKKYNIIKHCCISELITSININDKLQ